MKLIQINRIQFAFIQRICGIHFSIGKLSMTCCNYTYLFVKFMLLSNHSSYIPGKRIGCKSGHGLKTLPYCAFFGYSKATVTTFSFKNFLVSLGFLIKSVRRLRYLNTQYCTLTELTIFQPEPVDGIPLWYRVFLYVT